MGPMFLTPVLHGPHIQKEPRGHALAPSGPSSSCSPAELTQQGCWQCCPPPSSPCTRCGSCLTAWSSCSIQRSTWGTKLELQAQRHETPSSLRINLSSPLFPFWTCCQDSASALCPLHFCDSHLKKQDKQVL